MMGSVFMKKNDVFMSKTRTCDPSVCDCCQYIGDGGFLCDKYMEIVVEDWEPTRYFQMCMKKRKVIKVGKRKDV